MERLIGKKVWVIQYDDEDDTVLGVCDGFSRGFVAIRGDKDADPTLYVNLQNVREIEIYRSPGEGELRLLRFPSFDRPEEGKEEGGDRSKPGAGEVDTADPDFPSTEE